MVQVQRQMSASMGIQTNDVLYWDPNGVLDSVCDHLIILSLHITSIVDASFVQHSMYRSPVPSK